MNAAVRKTLGWAAAVLLNLGAVVFAVGLIVPRTDGERVLEIGIGMLVSGLVTGGLWLYGNRGHGTR